MRDNPGGGELDPAEDIHRRCKKNSLEGTIDFKVKQHCNNLSLTLQLCLQMSEIERNILFLLSLINATRRISVNEL